MLGRKRGRFDKGERVHTLVCVNSVEERERASTPKKRRGNFGRGDKERSSTLRRKRERVSTLGRKGDLIELQCQGERKKERKKEREI